MKTIINIKKKMIDTPDIGFAIIMTLFLMFGLIAFNDYNLSTDEEIERWTGLINYKEIMQIEDVKIGDVDFSAIPDLAEWRDRYYGVAAQYIPLLVEHLFGFQMETHRVYQIRHLFTFGVFWLSCFFFYGLCVRLGGRKSEALLGVLLLVLSPRILADSFYNIKDSVFLSVVIINLYIGIWFMEKPSVFKLFALAISTAVCVNIRILGAEIAAFCVFAMIVQGALKKQMKPVVYALAAGILSFIIYVVITPVTWGGIIEAVFGILSTFSDYSPWTGVNFFQGQALYAWELPWYYIPLWIVTTTPIVILVLMVAGSVFFVRGCKDKKFETSHGIVIAYVCVPLLYVIFRRPALYNGWRHFYFIYPGLVLAAVYGFRQINNRLRASSISTVVLGGTVGISLLSTSLWIIQNHPYECTYFNMLSRKYAAEHMEKDYWGMAQQDAILWIAENDPREHITIYGGYLNYLPEGAIKERLESAPRSQADYIVYSNTTIEKDERFDGYALLERKGEEDFIFDGFALYDQVHQIETNGFEICRVYQRRYNKNEGAFLRYENSSLYYDMNGMQWRCVEEEENILFEGITAEMLGPDRIALQSNGNYFPCKIELSEDGVSWKEYASESWTKVGESYLVLDLQGEKTRYIRMGFDKETIKQQDGMEWNLSFCYRTDEPITWRDSLAGIEGVQANENQWSQGFAVDGDVSTRWDSGISQRQGISYQIDLKEKILLGGITLDPGAYIDDYPRRIIVYGSQDGMSWNPIELKEEDRSCYLLEPTEVRYIKVELQEESSWNWSICEIKLWIVSQ